jgi:hypothetical protein
MRVFIILTSVFLLNVLNTRFVHSQHFVGMHKEAIMEVMKNSQKNFKLNTSTVNPHYKYLKYEDKINEMTMLFFLSEDDHCTLVRKMCDYSNFTDVLDELNQSYTATGDNQWEYTSGKQTYTVTLDEEEWFFTVTTRLKN